MSERAKLLIFGAGRIGRSFIGQLFSLAGYEVVFVDIDRNLVNLLNDRKSYYVIILDSNHPEQEKSLDIRNIRALHLSEEEEIIKEILEADILATSVGKTALSELSSLLASGIQRRYKDFPQTPVDIIIAENIRNADVFLRQGLGNSGLDLSLESYVGLIETSIGKMVPIMTQDQIQDDPLAVYAEPYNTLILDARAFRNPIPDVPGLSPKENIKAWVDRKLFIHNLGHAALAYQADYHYPDLVYTWEALEIVSLREKTRDTMLQSADILRQMYPGEFDVKQLTDHVDNLLERFANKALGDTIFRVGCDLNRKLDRDDRLMVPILAGIRMKEPFDLILEAWMKGCCFKASDVNGEELEGDKDFRNQYGRDFIRILVEHCRLKSGEQAQIYKVSQQLMHYMH